MFSEHLSSVPGVTISQGHYTILKARGKHSVYKCLSVAGMGEPGLKL